MTLAAFLAIATLHLMAAISPGPAVLMAARTGMTHGLRTGTFLAAGLGAGAVFWAGAALFGLTILFNAAPALLWALKLAGGAYLLWMAWWMWQEADRPLEVAQQGALPPTPASAFRLGLFTQLANPKPAVFFSAIFVGVVPEGTPSWIYAALLAVVFFNETVWNTAVARVFSFQRTRSRYISLKSLIDRVFGAMLASLGLMLVIRH